MIPRVCPIDWRLINRRLVAKALGELSYEQILSPEDLGDGQYRLDLPNGISYRFKAWRTVWDFLRVDEQTVTRHPELSNGLKADQFYLDANPLLGMPDITLANFLEELYRTLIPICRH